MKISTYILKRVIQIIPMLIAVTVFAFALTNLSGGDPAEIAVRNTGAQVTPENVEAMRIELGLDKPLIVQYLLWLKGAFMLDFGNSYVSGKPALEEIMTRFPNTLFLVLVASIIAIGVGYSTCTYCCKKTKRHCGSHYQSNNNYWSFYAGILDWTLITLYF